MSDNDFTKLKTKIRLHTAFHIY